MPKAIHESDVEDNVLDILKSLGYGIFRGENEDYLPGGPKALRSDFKDVVLVDRLRSALFGINQYLGDDVIEQAIKHVLRSESQKLTVNNESFHRLLVDGVDIPTQTDEGEKYVKVWLFDFVHPERNDFIASNQFTVIENGIERRADVILFVNGIPLVVMELKNLAEERADIWMAYDQLQTYMQQLPLLFRYNEILVVSDGIQARAGTMTSEKERFMQWKTINGSRPKDGLTEIEILLKGMFQRDRFLDLVRNFIVFEKNKDFRKKLAAYHQYWAVNRALASTKSAIRGGRKAGIVWHTQGSGKSLTMVFYTGKLVQQFDNPTVVVLTDRNDLDGQLFETFGHCQDVLRQRPVQAETRKQLQDLLKVSSGGVVFTTIQKFFSEEDREKYPVLSTRENIIVIADEAHRSQYGFSAKILAKQDKALITFGFAKYLRDALPNASFIGFTGTPIEKADRSTHAVFGEYVDTYDVKQAVEDGATVKIYYESRLAKLELKPEERPKIDPKFEEVTEGEEVEGKEKLKSKWARLEKVAGSPRRLEKISRDLVEHFEQKTSELSWPAKVMVVCMSRRICVALHDELVKERPGWYNKDDEKGLLKVVMTGSASDPKEWQEHIRNKLRRKRVGDNFKDPDHGLRILIVRDMFLTGFDAPSLYIMYLDKPMQGHVLMQAIARVNRVYPSKEGGFVVDYMGVGADLKQALMDYTASGGKGRTFHDQEEAVAKMQEKYEVVKDMFHGFDYKKFFMLRPADRVPFIPQAMEHILKAPDRKDRFQRETLALLKAFALAVPDERAMRIKGEVGFFQAVKSAITKTTELGAASDEKFDAGIKQILSKAVISDRIVDVFEAVGLQKPDVSVLSEGFLEEVKDMPQKNLAFEALKKLLNDQIRLFSRRNLVQGKSFMEMLDKTIKKYTNRSVETAQVIEELVELARKVRDEQGRGKQLNMTEDELAFYDALGVNDSAVKVLGDETLRKIALELTQMIRKSVTIDWTQRESVQAEIRLKVKKILRKYGYPPDKQERATQTVLQQAEMIARDWA